MGDISTAGRSWLRDAVAPGSATHNDPDKAQGRSVFDLIDLRVGQQQTALDGLKLGQTASTVAFGTLAELLAFVSPAANARGEVYADGSSNGVYRKTGAAGVAGWTKISDLAVTALDADLTFQANKLDFTTSRSFSLRQPLIVQRDVSGAPLLLISGGYAFREDLGYQPIAPETATGNDGQAYFRQELSALPDAVRFHMWDFVEAEPIINGLGPSPVPGYDYGAIATSIGLRLTSDLPIVGEDYGGLTRNVARFTTDAARAPWRYWTTQPVAFTEASILSRGVLVGAADPVNRIAAIGDQVPAEFVGFPNCFFRCLVETDTDDDFGAPKYFVFNVAGANEGGGLLALETRLSARAAIFSLRAPYLGVQPLGSWLVGVDTNATSANVIVGGVQAGFDRVPVAWVDWWDRAGADASATKALGLDADPDLVVPDSLYVWANQPTPLYLRHALPELPDAEAVRFSVSALPASGGGPVVASGSDAVPLALAAGDHAGELLMRKPQQPRTVWRRAVSIKAVSGGSGPPRVLMIGDSLTNRFLPEAVALRLIRAGFTPSMVGTIENFHHGVTAYMGEGREGRGFGQYIYKVAGEACVPLDVGDEAEYLALGTVAKMGINPFIRAATGGDDPDHVFNGHIFDLAHYLTRFAFDAPDAVVIQLGQNDASSAAYEDVLDGLRVMYERIRADFPTLPIAFSVYGVAKSGSLPERWRDINHRHIVRPTAAFVRRQGDTNLTFLASYLRQSPDAGWPFLAASTDPTTGLDWAAIDNTSSATSNGVTYGLGGDVHPLDLNVQLAADQIAAWIASL